MLSDSHGQIGEHGSLHSNSMTIINLENSNKQLLENQTFLHNENKKLQSNLLKLAKELEVMKKIATEHQDMRSASEYHFKKTIKPLHSSSSPRPVLKMPVDFEAEYKDRRSLDSAIEDLDKILMKIRSDQKKIDPKPAVDEISLTVRQLTKQLEVEQQKSEEVMSQLKKERNDEEKGLLKSKLVEMKEKITKLEVDNTKLKYQLDQYKDDLSRSKKQLDHFEADLTTQLKKNSELEDEIDRLKKTISDVENENLKLKKEMIEELNEANRAKRISIDTEIALQHVSEAYENKRKECMKYIDELDRIGKLVKNKQKESQEVTNPNEEN